MADEKFKAVKLSPCDVRSQDGILVINNLRVPYSLIQRPGDNNKFLIYRTAKLTSRSLTTHKDPEGRDKAVSLTFNVGMVNPEVNDAAAAARNAKVAELKTMIGELTEIYTDTPSEKLAARIASFKAALLTLAPEDAEPEVDPIVEALAEIGKLDATIEADVRQQIGTLLEQAKALCTPQAAPASV